MLLKRKLTDTITIERNTPTKSAGGAPVPSWAALSAATNIKAKIFKHSEKPKPPIADFGRRDWKGDFVAVCNFNAGAKPGDRINHGGVYYDIWDAFDEGQLLMSRREHVYVMDCSLRRVASGAS